MYSDCTGAASWLCSCGRSRSSLLLREFYLSSGAARRRRPPRQQISCVCVHKACVEKSQRMRTRRAEAPRPVATRHMTHDTTSTSTLIPKLSAESLVLLISGAPRNARRRRVSRRPAASVDCSRDGGEFGLGARWRLSRSPKRRTIARSHRGSHLCGIDTCWCYTNTCTLMISYEYIESSSGGKAEASDAHSN